MGDPVTLVMGTALGIAGFMEGKSAQRKQERAIEKQLAQEKAAMARAESLAREQMAMQERLAAQSAALYEQALYGAKENPRQPASASGSRSRESQAARSGPASTLLTGPGGIDVEELQLGRTSLLGA